MKLGIKMRLQDFESYPWEQVSFDLVEVHVADFEARESYEPIFRHLAAQKIPIGVHYFWPLPGFTIPTFAVDDERVREQTLANLRRCIAWAAERRIAYVVYHAGPRRVCSLDPQGKLVVGSEETPIERSAGLFLEHATTLAAEARASGVCLAVESETEQKPIEYFKDSPSTLIELGEQSPETILALAARGAPICVDFANLTTAFAAAGCRTRETLLASSLDFCRRVMPASALVVHVVSVMPPFLRDTRSGLTNLDQEEGVFPNREETRSLLEALAPHPNVVAIPEGAPYEGVWHNQLMQTLMGTLRS